MEISGEIHYANVEIDFDVDYLAETLATNHDFVDSTVLHAHVEEYCDSYVADRVSERVDEEIQELRVKVDDLDILHRELRGKIRELEPNNNYVRINDLRDVIDAQVDVRLTRILSDVMKGIEEYRKGN